MTQKLSITVDLINGARGRTRTGTVSLPTDFESVASTNFATWGKLDKQYTNIPIQKMQYLFLLLLAL